MLLCGDEKLHKPAREGRERAKGLAQKEAFANWALALAACLIINFCELAGKVNCLLHNTTGFEAAKQLQLRTRSSCHGSHQLPLIVCQPEAQKHQQQQQQQQQVLPTLVNYASIKRDSTSPSQSGELMSW